MPRTSTSASFKRQPTYPATINPSHAIGRKVTALISPHYGAPHVRPMEMLSRLPATIAAGAINGIATGVVGRAFRPSTTSSGVYWPARAGYCDGSQPFSIEIIFTYLGADAQFSRLFDFGAAGGTSGGWDLETDNTGSGLILSFWSGAGVGTLRIITTMVVGVTYHLVITCPGLTDAITYYVNNVPTGASVGVSITQSTSSNFFYSTYHTAGDLSCAGMALHLARFYQGAQLTPAEVKRLYEKPFEMFRRPRRVALNLVTSSGISGTASITEADDTVAATGTLKVQGAASITEASDTAAATGTVKLQGAAAITEADDTLAATGTVKLQAAATITEGDDTSAATGTVKLQAAASITEGDDTSAATGTVKIQGAASITEADDTLVATGAGTPSTTGTANITEADDTVAATATVKVQGAASITEAGDTAAATGQVKIQAAASLTEADDTVAAAAGLKVQGAAAITEADDTVAAVGAVKIHAAASITESDDTVVATGINPQAVILISDPVFTVRVPYRRRSVAIPLRQVSVSVPRRIVRVR